MLTIRNLNKTFVKRHFFNPFKIKNRTEVLKNINLTGKSKDLIYINGANGTGKTTFLRLIKGHLTPSSGEIEHGLPKKNIGLISRNTNSFFMRLTAQENLDFFLQINDCKKENFNKRDALVSNFQLKDLMDQECNALSTGQLQKLALVRDLCLMPEVLLLDEPLSSLDKEAKIFMKDYVIEMLRRGDIKCVFWVEHEGLDLSYKYLRKFELKQGKLANG